MYALETACSQVLTSALKKNVPGSVTFLPKLLRASVTLWTLGNNPNLKNWVSLDVNSICLCKQLLNKWYSTPYFTTEKKKFSTLCLQLLKIIVWEEWRTFQNNCYFLWFHVLKQASDICALGPQMILKQIPCKSISLPVKKLSNKIYHPLKKQNIIHSLVVLQVKGTKVSGITFFLAKTTKKFKKLFLISICLGIQFSAQLLSENWSSLHYWQLLLGAEGK